MIAGHRGALATTVLTLASVASGCEGIVTPVENPFQCIGVPAETCESYLAEARRSVPDSPPVSAVIRCTTTCTHEEGEAMILIVFANGTRLEYGAGWEAARGGGLAPVPAPLESLPPAPPAPPASVSSSGH